LISNERGHTLPLDYVKTLEPRIEEHGDSVEERHLALLAVCCVGCVVLDVFASVDRDSLLDGEDGQARLAQLDQTVKEFMGVVVQRRAIYALEGAVEDDHGRVVDTCCDIALAAEEVGGILERFQDSDSVFQDLDIVRGQLDSLQLLKVMLRRCPFRARKRVVVGFGRQGRLHTDVKRLQKDFALDQGDGAVPPLRDRLLGHENLVLTFLRLLEPREL